MFFFNKKKKNYKLKSQTQLVEKFEIIKDNKIVRKSEQPYLISQISAN